jgi:type IV secretion system protein TrbB
MIGPHMSGPHRTAGAGEADAPPAGPAPVMPGGAQFYQPITQQRLLSMLRSDLGPELLDALEDPSVSELSANSDQSVWVERSGAGRSRLAIRLSPERVYAVLALVASAKGEMIGESNPSFDALIPGGGYRFVGTLPPLTPGPSFTIRKKPGRVIPLAEYEAAGIVSATQRHTLTRAVLARENIIIAGGTGSGKTTLANALLQVMADAGQRIITIEDTPELTNSAADRESLYTVPGVRSMQDCLRSALRMHPDRIIFGEVRGAEVRDMLMAWNTGHRGGLCTLHADSAQDVLYRIEEMLETIPNFRPRPRTLARTIQLIAWIEAAPPGPAPGPARRLRTLARVEGLGPGGEYRLADAG